MALFPCNVGGNVKSDTFSDATTGASGTLSNVTLGNISSRIILTIVDTSGRTYIPFAIANGDWYAKVVSVSGSNVVVQSNLTGISGTYYYLEK